VSLGVEESKCLLAIIHKLLLRSDLYRSQLIRRLIVVSKTLCDFVIESIDEVFEGARESLGEGEGGGGGMGWSVIRAAAPQVIIVLVEKVLEVLETPPTRVDEGPVVEFEVTEGLEVRGEIDEVLRLKLGEWGFELELLHHYFPHKNPQPPIIQINKQ
jgi:hypothetical protein